MSAIQEQKKPEEKTPLVLKAFDAGPGRISVECNHPIGALLLGELPGGNKGAPVVIITLKGIVEQTKTVKLNMRSKEGSLMQISQTRPNEVLPDSQWKLMVPEFEGKRFTKPGYWWAKPLKTGEGMSMVVFVWSVRYDGSDQLEAFGDHRQEPITDWEPVARITKPGES